MIMTSENTYKVIELVSISLEIVKKAIENAIGRASQTLQGLNWFEVKEIRGYIKEDQVGWYQVKLGLGFRVLDPEELSRD
jgi:flavin-binding protein dodecin